MLQALCCAQAHCSLCTGWSGGSGLRAGQHLRSLSCYTELLYGAPQGSGRGLRLSTPERSPWGYSTIPDLFWGLCPLARWS